jgi:transposase InsO family protein
MTRARRSYAVSPRCRAGGSLIVISTRAIAYIRNTTWQWLECARLKAPKGSWAFFVEPRCQSGVGGRKDFPRFDRPFLGDPYCDGPRWFQPGGRSIFESAGQAAAAAIFRLYRTSASVEMLSDNGSPYIARETRIFAAQLGLKPCFTPVKSPQGNGISEAFVNTLKRDYVRVTPIPNAAIAMQAVASWFEDYNENHPHSGLKMRSPREVRSAQIATA